MTQLRTIHGELRLPAGFLQGQPMDEIERALHHHGLLPVEARERRWRLDHEHPGGYVLLFTYALKLPEERGHA